MTETYLVERSATIAAAPQHIYDRLVDFHAWMDWSPWEDLDPKQARSFTGAESGVGSRLRLVGQPQGREGQHADHPHGRAEGGSHRAGLREAVQVREHHRLLPDPEGPSSTRVRWTMVGPKTLAAKVMGLFTSMDKMIGPDFEKGLARLKDVVETRAPS